MAEKSEALKNEILNELKRMIPKSYDLVEKNIPNEESRYKSMYRLGVLESSIENLIDQLETGLIETRANKQLIKE